MSTLKFINKELIGEIDGVIVMRQPFKPATDSSPMRVWISKEEAVEWYNGLLSDDEIIDPNDVIEE